MMRTIKVLAVLVVIAGGYIGYAFWGELTPGEKHHIKDHAKNAVKKQGISSRLAKRSPIRSKIKPRPKNHGSRPKVRPSKSS